VCIVAYVDVTRDMSKPCVDSTPKRTGKTLSQCTGPVQPVPSAKPVEWEQGSNSCHDAVHDHSAPHV
jgi:hypothetical protein